jgi:hypothetical protein
MSPKERFLTSWKPFPVNCRRSTRFFCYGGIEVNAASRHVRPRKNAPRRLGHGILSRAGWCAVVMTAGFPRGWHIETADSCRDTNAHRYSSSKSRPPGNNKHPRRDNNRMRSSRPVPVHKPRNLHRATSRRPSGLMQLAMIFSYILVFSSCRASNFTRGEGKFPFI